MASLKEQLTQLLPKILPESPENAINGTELLEKVRPKLRGEYADASVRWNFSKMADDPTSPIARVDQGHGYYLRTARSQVAVDEEDAEPNGTGPRPSPAAAKDEDVSARRAAQSEEKFRALFMRWSELKYEFPMLIEHTKAARQAGGINKWKFPDVALIKWEVGEDTDKGFRLEKNLLEIKRSLGEQPFRLKSVELKVELTAGTLREAFFQCVSNSKWAHSAQLTVACKLTDNAVTKELRRLGASYNVSVVSFGLEPTQVEALESADKLRAMAVAEFDKLSKDLKVSETPIVVGEDRDSLDWEHIRDLQEQSSDIRDLFAWVAYCLEKKQAFTLQDWRKYG